MKGKIILLVCIFMICVSFMSSGVFAQTRQDQAKDEKEEGALAVLSQLHEILIPYKLSARIYAFSGYDNNPRLSTNRKGDVFEEITASVDFSKPFIKKLKFTFDYDLDVMNYNDFTDMSNVLNHLKLGLHGKFSSFTIGTGYDLGVLYYPNNRQGDFLLHKGFVYLRHNITKKLYHQIEAEPGLKDYTHKKAMADTINTDQDKDRRDDRLALTYSVASQLNAKLFLKFSSNFTVNDSNARYIDFYDYSSWRQSLYGGYSLTRKTYVYSRFSYTDKQYNSRTIISGDSEQHDRLYSGTLGITYRLNKANMLLLSYTYRQNVSNDSIAEYSGSLIKYGWQYRF